MSINRVWYSETSHSYIPAFSRYQCVLSFRSAPENPALLHPSQLLLQGNQNATT